MKKILSIIITASLLFAGITAFAADITEVKETPYYVDVILHYGIMDMENSTDFLESETVPRAEAVRFILNLINEDIASTDYLPFNDVSPYDSYYGVISTAYNRGLVSGNGNGYFYPNRNITTGEAATILLRAMGYSVMVGNGSLNTYESLASSKGFLKGVSSDNGYITRGGLAKLLYNSFSIGIVEQTSFGESSEYTVSSSKTALSFRGLVKGEGVVSANSISSIYYSSVPAKTNGIRINNEEYFINDKTAEDLLGYYTEYYYFDEQHSDELVIDYIFAKNNEISKYDLEEDKYSESNGRLIYTDENGRSKTINVSSNAAMILNGEAVPYDLSYIINGGNTGDFTLIEHPGESEVSVIIINSFINDIVSGIDKENGYIYVKYNLINGKNYIELPVKEENGKISASKNGKVCEYYEALNGDVISFAVSVSGNNAVICFSDRKITGVLESEDPSERSVVIGGKGYEKTTDFPQTSEDFKIGSSITAYFNFRGKIADIGYTLSKRYAYVLKAGFSNEYEKRGIVKLFTSGGSAENYRLAEKIKINGGEETENGSEYFRHESVIARLSDTKGQLISYELNKDDEIINVFFAAAPSGDEYEDRNKFILSKTKTETDVYSGYTIDGIICKTSIVFSIPNEAEPDEKDCSSSIGNLTRGRNYSSQEVIKFYDVGFDGSAGAVLLIQKAELDFKNNPTSVCVVKKIVDSVDRNGASCKKMYYFSNGSESSVNISSEAAAISKSGTKIVPVSELSAGDIITFETNSDGELKIFCMIFDCSSPADDSVLFVNGEGVANNRELCVIKGILRYKNSSDLVVEYSINGKAAYEPMSYSPGTMIIVVNRTSKSVKIESIDKLKATNFASNIPGDNIIVAGNRNSLTEAVLYE